MTRFKYKDYAQKFFRKGEAGGSWDAPVLFACEAELLTEGDKLYEQKLGKDPSKQKTVAVELDKIST